LGEGVLAENGDLEQKLRAGIAAAQSGDRPTARRLLEQVVEGYPDNELAWIWLASCVTTLRERRECLERVLQINPHNARAREALGKLGAETTAQAAQGEEQVERLRRAQSQPAPAPRPAAAPQSAGGGLNIRNLIIGVLAALVIAGGLFGLSALGDLIQEPTPTAVVLQPTPLPTSTPIPTSTRTAIPFQGTSLAPTLPPTFTPTFTPTATATPLPTSTPYPLDQFVLLLASLEEGAVQPELYRMAGDGTGAEMHGSGFRDVAYDPSGLRIAFIRDVEYTGDDGSPVLLPELFVADVNDLANAQQITQLRTTIVSGPTWSPEGREIVFTNNFGGFENLWYITPDGENLRDLTQSEFVDRDPAWSPIPGSRRIVFASDRSSVGRTELFSFEIADPGTEPEYRRLTVESRNSYAPAWSPDGRLITFVSDRTADADIYIMEPDGTRQTLLTIDDGGAEDRSPSFTSDGRWVVFISNREDDRFQSYLVSLRGDILVRLTNHDRDDISIVYRPEPRLGLR
jgi:hypothetical protein